MIYLDYSATTPVDEFVLDSYVKTTRDFIGNPNSLHKLGVNAKRLIDAATKQITNILGIKENEIIYTSGASEANNMAIKGICLKYQNRGKHIITTELEHSSVIAPISYLQSLGFEIDFVKLDSKGVVDLEDLERLMRDDTILVSIALVNSEVGVIQPIEEISRVVKKYPKAYFHSDITQSIGKMRLNLSCVDLASFSAQKFYGMKGIGGLIKKENIVIEPLIHGGKSTTVFRSGTPAVALIVSMAKALRLAYDQFDRKINEVNLLNRYLVEELNKLFISVNSNECCVGHIVNISIGKIKPETMLHALEEKDIYISTQTACSMGIYSKAVFAVTGDLEKAKHSIRISLSHLTTRQEIEEFLNAFSSCLAELDKISR